MAYEAYAYFKIYIDVRSTAADPYWVYWNIMKMEYWNIGHHGTKVYWYIGILEYYIYIYIYVYVCMYVGVGAAMLRVPQRIP